MKAKQVVILTPSATSKFGTTSNQADALGGNGGQNESEGGENSEGAEGESKKFGKDEEILLDA